MCVCVCVCVYIYIYIYIHTHTQYVYVLTVILPALYFECNHDFRAYMSSAIVNIVTLIKGKKISP